MKILIISVVYRVIVALLLDGRHFILRTRWPTNTVYTSSLINDHSFVANTGYLTWFSCADCCDCIHCRYVLPSQLLSQTHPICQLPQIQAIWALCLNIFNINFWQEGINFQKIERFESEDGDSIMNGNTVSPTLGQRSPPNCNSWYEARKTTHWQNLWNLLRYIDIKTWQHSYVSLFANPRTKSFYCVNIRPIILWHALTN